mgnify:CR=1 FL=1
MLDIRFVRENIDLVNKAMESRNFTWDSKRFLQLDEDRRSAIAQEEALLSQRNTISKSIGKLMGEGKKEEAEVAKAEVAKLKEQIAYYSDLHEQAESALKELILAIPNIPSETTPIGKDEDDNPEVRRWGTPPTFDFEFKAHWDLGVDLGIIDFERAVKLAESRFVLLGGLGARLERALISFMADTHVSRGYKEWWCPVMANAKTLTGTGQLPKFEEDLFKTTEGLYLIPTAEVQLTNIHSDEVLNADQLPLKYCAFTPCFREEAGSAGRDTRGLIRLHQFDKVEIVQLSLPEVSYEALDGMVAHVESIVRSLGLPYRIVRLCGGDMSFTSALTYDFEVYSEAQQRWLEVSSVSNFESFQANRLKLRYRDENKKTQLAHTLNGSSLALPRIVAALLENNQTPEGIRIPEVLIPYTGFDIIK